MSEFFNPYNFVPTPPRTGDFPKELSDSSPMGHHRLQDDRWNGTISVRMKAVSPLLVPSGRVDVDGQGHKTKHTRVIDGQVVIPPSSVKGMIRSAFESVTNSRFGEFSKRFRDPLTFRQIASNGLEAFPAVLLEGGVVRVLLGDSSRPTPVRHGEFAKVSGFAATSVRITRLDDSIHGEPLSHGELVEFESVDGKAVAVTRWDPSVSKHSRFGRVYRTGLTENNRVGKFAKQSERIFDVDGKNDLFLKMPDHLYERWETLIADAREKHEGDEKEFADYVRAGSHDWTKLKAGSAFDGSLMYVRLRWDENMNRDENSVSQSEKWVIDEVQPVAISRQLHPDSPYALLDPSLRPPVGPSEFSPAEHVFGWVHAEGKDARTAAYAGSVRFGPIESLSNDPVERFDQPNTLPILDRPKPEQSRFYLGVSKNGTVVPFDKKVSKQEVRYAAGRDRALRGRKVYPTQNRQPKHTTNQRGKQNQTYRDHVKAGSEFCFALNVRNLSSTELGALLTVLDLDSVIADGAPRCLGFGGAKPLGYGSVSVSVDWKDSNLRRGSEDIAAFRELRSAASDHDGARSTTADFVRLVSGRPFFEAFKVATKGYSIEDTVHYPRVEPSTGDANKDSLEWFMANESDPSLRHPLPPLSASREGKMTTHQPRSRGGGRPKR